LSIYEVLSAGCQFLAADRGGIPELIPPSHHRDVLTPLAPSVMRARIEHACRIDGALRHDMVASLQAATAAMLEANRRANLATIRACYGAAARTPAPPAPPRIALMPALFTVAVPMLNPAPQDLLDLCSGLNAQTLPPEEVIFVDDGSEPALRRQAEAIVAAALRLPWRFIAHATNRGLAAARNTALAETRTRYFVPVDVDNIPMADNFRHLVHAMEADPRLWAATCYLQLFTEAVDWRDLTAVQDQNHGRGVYFRPLGGGIVHSLIDNNLGDAHGCYRVDAIRAIGGWDSYGKAKWEDWSLYLNILSRNGRILVVPSADHLYRTRPGSMQHVYPRFPADRLKARALDLLPRFDRYRLIALARELERLRAAAAQPPTRLRAAAAQPPTRLRHRAADAIGIWLDHAPRFKYALALMLLTIYRTGRHLNLTRR
jgi:glycosyltransferase involved in cell wall biosynthesis